MAGGHERDTQTEDVIRLASPIFYEVDIFDLRENKLNMRLISNKFVYLISYFNPSGRIAGRVYFGYTNNYGILYDETRRHRMMILPGKYFIFVTEKPIDNYHYKIARHNCNEPINIVPDTKEIIIPGKGVILCTETIYAEKLFHSSFKIGNFSNRTQRIRSGMRNEMIVRRYGIGMVNGRAIFLIGRLHGTEGGAENSIKIMEDYIKENPCIVPVDTSVFILNPASNTIYRNIHRINSNYNINPDNNLSISIDPNRNFLDRDIERLNETEAIAFFTRKLIEQQWRDITIISAHQYNDEDGQRPTTGKGWVFPLYELMQDGIKEVTGKNGNTKIEMKENIHYTVHRNSSIYARVFENFVKFEYEPMWLNNSNDDKGEMYPGEYIYYISRLNSSISMIEYEIPQSDKDIEINDTRNGLIAYIRFLLER